MPDVADVPASIPTQFRFKIGDAVQTQPDTRPNVRANRGEFFIGTVDAIDYTTRLVTINLCMMVDCILL